MLTDEYRYKILKMIEADPQISQREIAQQLDISLGKVNYCLKALVQVGLIKVNNFRNNKNKIAYIYILTPKGLEEKASITMRFLKSKTEEYKALQAMIEELRSEVAKQNEV